MSRVTINVNGLSLAHEDSGGVSTATLPDVCLTPGAGAVPYPNVALSRDLASGTSLVRADGGHRIAVAGSSFARSTGGEPGSGGGVTSGVSGREATFLTHSFDVTIEGRGACRLTDKMLHNRGNTIDCSGLAQATVVESRGDTHPVRGSTSSSTKKKPHPVESAPQMTYGLDTNNSTLKTAYALSQQPARSFVGRYLIAFDKGPYQGTSNMVNPGLTPDEASRIHGGGMTVFAIWEVTKYRAIQTGTAVDQYALGKADAEMAKKQMARFDANDRPIYFTVDFGVTSVWWNGHVISHLPKTAYPICKGLVALHEKTGTSAVTKDLVKAYFRGIGDVLPVSRVGAYGTYTTVRKLLDLGLIGWGWQWAFGPNGTPYTGKIDQRAQLLQTSTTTSPDPAGDNSFPWGVSGAGALDLDTATQTDFGQWPIAKDMRGAPQ